jgi:CDP-diacylglycerol--glycerol-3-phosphate 3-phosphatidyltransferase
LKWKWAGIFFLCSLLLAGSFRILLAWGTPGDAVRWVALASLGTGYLLLTLWNGLSLNRRGPEAPLLGGLGWGNGLSLLRGSLVALMAGFLALPEPGGWLAWVPGSLYLSATLLDFVDGYAARVSGRVTLLGRHLDISLDGLGLAIGVILAIQYGRLPLWYLPVGLVRYFFLAGSRWRNWRAQPVHELDEQPGRRALAGAQMGFVAVILFPLFDPPGTYLVAAVFMAPFLLGFWRDWRFVVTGKDLFAPLAGRIRQVSVRRWLPLFLRLAASALLAGLLIRRFAGYPDQAAVILALGAPGNVVWTAVLVAAEGLLAAAILLGIAGRVVALAGMLLMGLYQAHSPLDPWQTLFLIIAASLFFLGTGALSLWTPEELLIRKRPGEA